MTFANKVFLNESKNLTVRRRLGNVLEVVENFLATLASWLHDGSRDVQSSFPMSMQRATYFIYECFIIGIKMCDVDRLQQLAKKGISFWPTSHYPKDDITAPAQKISEGHQACFGGRAAWEGNGELRGAVALGTAVETVVACVDDELKGAAETYTC